jgi:hypothetical protein
MSKLLVHGARGLPPGLVKKAANAPTGPQKTSFSLRHVKL